MKQLFTICICLLLLAANQLVKAQTCHAGVISALKDTICLGQPASLIVTGSNGNIQWQSTTTGTFTNITGATGTSLQTNPLLQTTYFRVMVSNGSCADTSVGFRVFVPALPTADFTTSQFGDSLMFNSDSSKGNIARYHWDFGDGDTSNVADLSHRYAKDTAYFACLTAFDSFGCSYTFCKSVEGGSGTEGWGCLAAFTYSYKGDTVYFKANNPIQDYYHWDFGDSTDTVSLQWAYPHVYSSTGVYLACLMTEFAPEGTCKDCHEVAVYVNAVKPIPGNNQTLVIYPNPCADCEIKGIENPDELLVTDLLGRVIPVSFSKQSNGYWLNFTSACSGMYLVKNIRTGEVVKVVRE